MNHGWGHDGWARDAKVARHRDGLRTPLMTLKEAAEEFGITHSRIRALFFSGASDAPKPVLLHKPKYYDQREMREWWLRYQLKEPSKGK